MAEREVVTNTTKDGMRFLFVVKWMAIIMEGFIAAKKKNRTFRDKV